MEQINKIKRVAVELICILYVLLFIYAAVSKLLDFENFQVQLGQSPLLSAFAWWVSGLVPIIELGIVVLLAIPKWRTLGLFASLSLMTMFTSYIFIVLHFSAFVPCSCGGILEKMSWNTHLVFNCAFVVLAVVALVWQNQINTENRRFQIRLPLVKSIPIAIVSSIGIVIILFLCSEDLMQRKNPFVRRYIRRSIELVHSVDLKFNSYYFSGYNQGTMYLGNYTDPLRMLSMDSSFTAVKGIEIDFKNRNFPFRSVKVLVRGNYFFLKDGSVPGIFKGRIEDWKITEELKGVPNFTLAEPIDSTSMVFRNNTGEGAAHILGVFNSNRSSKVKYLPTLLQKQIDGIFDTDGMLLFNAELGRIVYVYFYRNEIILADNKGALEQRQHTIDTISKAKIKIAYLKEGSQRKMASPPALVNANTATISNLLFVESKVPGLYEDDAMWKQAAIIDVYNLKKNTYVLSFPIFGVKENKLQSLFVTKTHLYVILGTKLKIYELNDSLKKEMINGM
ncbi:MauE/DoxX family redox-associated membrane protein [Flavobacterium sp. LB2R40]|uniref:MauE/DoxX family redox-associated membrane protein n=1 Tax=Flavobacterium sp. LB2R40 TaxID=3401722 RepID=UPI003AAA27E6